MFPILIGIYLCLGYFYASWFVNDPGVKGFFEKDGITPTEQRNIFLVALLVWPPLVIYDAILILASIFPPGPR